DRMAAEARHLDRVAVERREDEVDRAPDGRGLGLPGRRGRAAAGPERDEERCRRPDHAGSIARHMLLRSFSYAAVMWPMTASGTLGFGTSLRIAGTERR